MHKIFIYFYEFTVVVVDVVVVVGVLLSQYDYNNIENRNKWQEKDAKVSIWLAGPLPYNRFS